MSEMRDARCKMQDKELGHKWPKSLSAHRFLRASAHWGWDTGLGYGFVTIGDYGGTRPSMSRYVPDFPL